MFADADDTVHSGKQGTPAPGWRAYVSAGIGTSAEEIDATTDSPIPGTGGGDELQNENGFALSFLGIATAFAGGEVGATGSFRFGPSVPEYYAGDMAGFGIDNLTQGFVTWSPTDEFSMDIGLFGTIFGAEVAESWQNLNYTRGALYYSLQPFWYTGPRASYEIVDEFGLT